jgi:hypothetical protein
LKNLTQAQQKTVLIVLLAALVLLIVYRTLTEEKPKTMPLTYQRGAVASLPVRQGLSSRQAGSDPLNAFLERRGQKYPGVVRDIFRMENPVPKPKLVASHMTATPPVHIKSPEEIAAEAAQAAVAAARADLMKFQFLGYLTEKDSTLFLSKDGELFIVKRGDTIMKSYKVKEGSKNYVVLLDTVTGVEVRLEIPSGELVTQQPQQQKTSQERRIQLRRHRIIQTPAPAGASGPLP